MRAITGVKIVTPNRVLEGCSLIFDRKILKISKNIPKNIDTIDANGLYLSAGFIDLHIHGLDGADSMDATKEALDILSNSIVRSGVTSFLPTTMTCSRDRIREALKNILENRDGVAGAKVLGVHLEGPFINPKKSGAQNSKYIQKPDITLIEDYLEIIKIVTVAPEVDGIREFIDEVGGRYPDILFSIGHTEANYQEAKESFKWGVRYATHLFNAMGGMHHREPSAVEAVLDDERISCELIADNIHLHPIYYSLTYKLKRDRVILVTDAIRATCLKSGVYELGGQRVYVDESGRATLESGTIAGSTLRLNEALRNFYRAVDISIPELIKLVTVTPAKILNLKLGKIARGYPADLVLFDDNFNIRAVFVDGEERLNSLC